MDQEEYYKKINKKITLIIIAFFLFCIVISINNILIYPKIKEIKDLQNKTLSALDGCEVIEN